MIPAICFLIIGYIFSYKTKILVWIKNAVILAFALTMLIPASAKITKHIEDTYTETIHQKINAALNLEQSETKEGKNPIVDFFKWLADNVSGLVDAAKNALSACIDAVAILLITSLVIPFLTLLVFLRAIKTALNIEIPKQYLDYFLCRKKAAIANDA